MSALCVCVRVLTCTLQYSIYLRGEYHLCVSLRCYADSFFFFLQYPLRLLCVRMMFNHVCQPVSRSHVFIITACLLPAALELSAKRCGRWCLHFPVRCARIPASVAHELCRNSGLTHTHAGEEEDEVHFEIQGFSELYAFFSFSYCQKSRQQLWMSGTLMCFHSTTCASRSPVRSQSPAHLMLRLNPDFFSTPATHFSSALVGSPVGIYYHTQPLCIFALFFLWTLSQILSDHLLGPHSRPQQSAQPKPGGHPAHQSWSPLSKDFLLMSVHEIRQKVQCNGLSLQ